MSEIKNVKLLITVVNRENQEPIMKIYKKHKVSFFVMTHGSGTGSSSLMEYFGINEIKKNVIFSVIPADIEMLLMKDLQEKLKIYLPGRGIAFTISISSSSKYLSNLYNNVSLKKEVYTMKNNEDFDLIMLIVEEGYAEQAMSSAKKTGAKGGTLIHGRGLGTKEATKFLGITIEPEKDIVMILVNKKEKMKIMEKLTESVGLSTPGRGICFSVPVDNVVGFSEHITFEKLDEE